MIKKKKKIEKTHKHNTNSYELKYNGNIITKTSNAILLYLIRDYFVDGFEK